MSLLDSLLVLDAPRLDAWIAVRTDGVKGSGTETDPYDGSSKPLPAISLTSLTRIGTEATAITGSNHGFIEGDMVTISGVTVTKKPGIFWPEEYYVGTFPIMSVTPNSFKYVMLGVPDASPAPGTIQCWKEREQFDVLMRNMPANTTVRLGPGVLETKGFAVHVAGGWVPKSGQRFVGSGIYLTTLKIVGVSNPYPQHSAFATIKLPTDAGNPAQWLDGFEASDFTVDCNLDGQPGTDAICGAIVLDAGGRHIRIRRVRAIHFGSRAPNGQYSENFVFYANSRDIRAPGVSDVVIEDCIAELPSPNISWNSTIFNIGGVEDGISKYHSGCVLRNNYVNCEIVYGPLTAVNTITFSNPIATITTQKPHGHVKPGNVSMQGVLVNGSTDNAFNGVFAIEQIVSDTQLTYKPYPADNPTAGTPSVGAGTVIGAPVSGHYLTIKTITPVAPPTFRIETYIPHNR